MKKREPSYTVDGNVNWYRHYEEQYQVLYKGVLLSHEEECKNAICSNMDEPRDYHTK